MIKIFEDHIRLETPNTSLVLSIKSFDDAATPYNKGRYYLALFYYGDKASEPTYSLTGKKINYSGSCNNYSYDTNMTNTFGDCNAVRGCLLVKNVDKTYVNRFFYEEAYVIENEVDNHLPHSRDVLETLVIVEEDKEAELVLKTYYSIFSDSDVIAVKKELINNNDESVSINNIASLQISLFTKEVEVFTYDGSWIEERTRHSVKLNSGVFVNESVLFTSSHKHNPFIQVKDNTNNRVYSFNLVWSGNHRESIDIDSITKVATIQVGLNSYTFDYCLKGHQSFITPEAIMSVAASLEESSSINRVFSLNHIVDKKWHKARPILFNSWEGNAFNISDDTLFKMADVCNDVGVELFVIDDGWFGHRINDYSSLGDWWVDKSRFPNGFGHTAEVIKSKGLKFGFWIEPEMICIDSETYRNHPEFACMSSIRQPLERRHQLMIDMSNPEVVDYLFHHLSKVIEETKPSYIKWDFNRNMADAYSVTSSSGEFSYKYTVGSYELMKRLVEKYPDILFEGCSSGGGRFDLGIAYYMPQSWGSDNSNAYCRTKISCGSFAGYHQSIFGAHVSRDGYAYDDGKRYSSLEDRFNLQCIGGFGYEFDVTKRTTEELSIMKEQIKFYKEYRDIIQFGNLVTVDNIFDNEDYLSYQISKDNTIIYVAINPKPGIKSKAWKLVNLDRNSVYKVSSRKHLDGNNIELSKDTYTGEELMNEGIKLPALDSKADTSEYDGIFTRLLVIEKL